jgi:hypothetical protein
MKFETFYVSEHHQSEKYICSTRVIRYAWSILKTVPEIPLQRLYRKVYRNCQSRVLMSFEDKPCNAFISRS